MIQWITPPERSQILYPDSDGKPMSDNTKQFRWIHVLYSGIANVFRERADVFVAGDLLWYAVEGEPKKRTAPDVMVVFGRPKGDRGSYRQWEEEDIAPQVAFEVLSPGNTYQEMIDKFLFYEQYGIEEYYVYNPDNNRLEVSQRKDELLRPIRKVNGWVSPLLGIRFELTEQDMVVYGPDGRRFMTYEELMTLYETAEKARETVQKRAELAEQQVEQERQRADFAEQLVEQGRQRAEQGQQRAEQERQRAESAKQRADSAEQRAARLAEKLRQLGIDPNGG